MSGAATLERSGARIEPFGLWGRAFRPFFLAAGLMASLALPWWTSIWLGLAPAPAWLVPSLWHGHEMLFGFVAAAIAGFLLTASPVWSGGPALSGRPLAALLALWVAGRVAMATAGSLPPWVVAAVDASFLPAVALAVVRTLWGSGQRRNYGLVGVVMLLATANAAMHADALGWATGIAAPALRLAVEGVIVLLLVVAGRITPAFTQNAFRSKGLTVQIRARPWVGGLAIGAVVALAVTGVFLPRSGATGALALVAGSAALVRLAGWQSWHTRADPLLWSLHAGSAWLAVGLLLVAAGDLGLGVPAAAGVHALTAGAMGAAILAVMTRVSLGHTGRPLALPAHAVACYALVHAAALARVASTFFGSTLQQGLLVASTVAWAAAFALFLVLFAPILVAPRPDGRPG